MRRPPSERELRQAPLPALPRSALPWLPALPACSACSGGWLVAGGPCLLCSCSNVCSCSALGSLGLAWVLACLLRIENENENSELGFES